MTYIILCETSHNVAPIREDRTMLSMKRFCFGILKQRCRSWALSEDRIEETCASGPQSAKGHLNWIMKAAEQGARTLLGTKGIATSRKDATSWPKANREDVGWNLEGAPTQEPSASSGSVTKTCSILFVAMFQG